MIWKPKYLMMLAFVLLLAVMTHAGSYEIGAIGISDAPSDGTQYVRKDAGWEAFAASGGGSTARIVPVDDFYLNQSVTPDVVGLLDGSGVVRDFYRWDGNTNYVLRLDPIKVWAAAGRYLPVYRTAGFVTNALSQTNAMIVGYVDDAVDATGAVVDLSAVTINTFWTNGILVATGDVTFAEDGWHEFDARVTDQGGTDGYLFSHDIHIDIGAAQ